MVVALFAGLAVTWTVLLWSRRRTTRAYRELVAGVEAHRRQMRALSAPLGDVTRRINDEAKANWDDPAWQARMRQQMVDSLYDLGVDSRQILPRR